MGGRTKKGRTSRTSFSIFACPIRSAVLAEMGRGLILDMLAKGWGLVGRSADGFLGAGGKVHDRKLLSW